MDFSTSGSSFYNPTTKARVWSSKEDLEIAPVENPEEFQRVYTGHPECFTDDEVAEFGKPDFDASKLGHKTSNDDLLDLLNNSLKCCS